MSEYNYTPDTSHVRDSYLRERYFEVANVAAVGPEFYNEFDRWLAHHDAGVRLALLEEQRAEIQTWFVYETRDLGDAYASDTVTDLVSDRIEKEAGGLT